MTARPILKWAGGKTDSVPNILEVIPKVIETTYFEPFVGGGAVFFALAAASRFRKAVLADSCGELMDLYTAVRDELPAVERALRMLGPSRITAEKYYRIRASKPRTLAGRAARTLFLNKNGYNGLYRVNRAGGFNVPWAHRPKWKPDFENLRAVSEVLRDVELLTSDFASVARLARPGDVVYFDPPYLAESKTARFVGYTPDGFSVFEQRRLAELFEELAARGVHVVASNADVRGTMILYGDIEGTEFWRLKVKRRVNSNGAKRGQIGELLMVNPGAPPGEVRNDGS